MSRPGGGLDQIGEGPQGLLLVIGNRGGPQGSPGFVSDGSELLGQNWPQGRDRLDLVLVDQRVEVGEQGTLPTGGLGQQLDIAGVGLGVRSEAESTQPVIQDARPLGRDACHTHATECGGSSSENRAA